VLVPAPGTVPGCHETQVRGWVDTVHAAGALRMTAVGTSQEGADDDTIRRIALMAKMTGTDVHHLGDCGLFGIALPENLLAYGIAIRGRRHTYRRLRYHDPPRAAPCVQALPFAVCSRSASREDGHVGEALRGVVEPGEPVR
jgi:hypothetical protein